MIFVRERRCKISAANPDMPVLQIMKEVGSQWQSLNPEEKQFFQAMADEDKIRYKLELKEFEKEVEKLQINKVVKPKANNKNKRKVADTKNESQSEVSELIKSEMEEVASKPEVIEIEDGPTVAAKKAEEILTKVSKVDDREVFCKEYSQLLRQNQSNTRNLDPDIRAVEKWNSMLNPDRVLFTKSPNLIKNLVSKDIAKLQEESKCEKIPTPPQNIFKDDTLIKRPMNIFKQEPAVTLNKSPTNQNMKEPMREPMGEPMREPPRYQMRADSNQRKESIDHDGIMFSNSLSILDPRKRNRRLSSIVGVKSSPYDKEFDFEEVLEPRNAEYTKPNSRTASIDFNMQYEYGQESPY